VVYTELLNDKDSLITRQILPMRSGISWSEIALPPSLKQGNYRLRAYTNWMRNFGTAYFYDQRIRVGGIAPVAKIINYTNPDVQFFPEGGELVNDIRSKIAVKAVNSSGFGEDIQGVIEDDAGNVVTDFATQHLGMGIFAITPQAGKSYRAKINAPNGTSFIVNLPIANEEGYALKINTTLNDSIQVKVTVNDKTFTSQKGNRFFIVAQSAGKVYYTSQGNLNQSAYTAAVAKSRFPSGIVQFTLFSQSGEPLAERLAYVQRALLIMLTARLKYICR
jgi:hypothetical protein